MTDLRARLEHALLRHAWTCSTCNYERFRNDNQHLADVLLSLPGIAIVELPSQSWPHDYGQSFNSDVSTFKNRVLVGTDLDLSAAYARDLAAALLAAANAADSK